MSETASVEGAPDLATAAGAPSTVSGERQEGPVGMGPARPAGAASGRTVDVRPARPDDVPEILAMIRELADYERSLSEVTATQADLTALLFGSNTPSGAPGAYCHVIDADPASGGLAGFALWFLNASTWLGRHGVYLEDLYVRPQYRGCGYGQALMSELAAICVERGYGRLEWWVLDWNEPALGFYRSIGAAPMDEWTVHRLTGDALEELATRRRPG